MFYVQKGAVLSSGQRGYYTAPLHGEISVQRYQAGERQCGLAGGDARGRAVTGQIPETAAQHRLEATCASSQTRFAVAQTRIFSLEKGPVEFPGPRKVKSATFFDGYAGPGCATFSDRCLHLREVAGWLKLKIAALQCLPSDLLPCKLVEVVVVP